MSFQAYLDTIESKTGRTPRELLTEAARRGFEGPAVKAAAVLDWLKQDYDLGRGHAMALVHLIKHGPTTPGAGNEDTAPPWLDGRAAYAARNAETAASARPAAAE